MLWHPKNPGKILLCTMFFFIFGRFFHCRKATKMTQNSISIPSCAQWHPKILEKCRKHHRILVSVRNRFWGLVSVRNRFWAPPPPAKADIATAILTNVIEHLVLLLPPHKHAFTAKAVWADFRASPSLPTIHSFWFCLFNVFFEATLAIPMASKTISTQTAIRRWCE